MVNSTSDKLIERTELPLRGGSLCRACPVEDSLAIILACLRRIDSRLSHLEGERSLHAEAQPHRTHSDNGSESLLSVKEAADRLGVSRTTLYRLVASGDLKSMRVGARRGAVRIAPDALHDYVVRQTRKVREGRDERPRRALRLKHIKVRH